MNKFEEIVGNNSNAVLARRATHLADTAKLSQESLMNTLKTKKAELEGKIINLTDLAPTSKDSLAPGVADFNAKNWVEELQNLKLKLYDLEVSIKLANETYSEYFVDKKASDKSTKSKYYEKNK